MESHDFSYLFNNSWKSPVNIYKIIEDVKYNYRELLDNNLDPIYAIDKVNNLCDYLPYTYLNNIFKELKI